MKNGRGMHGARVSWVCTGTFEKNMIRMKKGLSILYSALFLISCTSAKDGQIDLASFSSYVNPFIRIRRLPEVIMGLEKPFLVRQHHLEWYRLVQTLLLEGIMEVVTAMNIRLLKDSLLHKCRELVGMAI